ncbi:unnamed protein product [Clonostachys rosea f. rosea IK726]|uniref:Uncharacterized protein n=1 Tax=Clonostachys rosea f. rosea IK726 TaxID=1349383 RepID=A0ACA9UDA6_BIOOC|nr:unnamed protein product [Clonostachys rosea f. rosea IK726]
MAATTAEEAGALKSNQARGRLEAIIAVGKAWIHTRHLYLGGRESRFVNTEAVRPCFVVNDFMLVY